MLPSGFAISCTDRLVFLDDTFEVRGQLFLTPDGIVIITDAGVFGPPEKVHDLVRAYGEDGASLSDPGSVPMISGIGADDRARAGAADPVRPVIGITVTVTELHSGRENSSTA